MCILNVCIDDTAFQLEKLLLHLGFAFYQKWFLSHLVPEVTHCNDDRKYMFSNRLCLGFLAWCPKTMMWCWAPEVVLVKWRWKKEKWRMFFKHSQQRKKINMKMSSEGSFGCGDHIRECSVFVCKEGVMCVALDWAYRDQLKGGFQDLTSC